MLLYRVNPRDRPQIGSKRMIDLACEVAFQAAHDLRFGQTLGCATLDVGSGVKRPGFDGGSVSRSLGGMPGSLAHHGLCTARSLQK